MRYWDLVGTILISNGTRMSMPSIRSCRLEHSESIGAVLVDRCPLKS